MRLEQVQLRALASRFPFCSQETSCIVAKEHTQVVSPHCVSWSRGKFTRSKPSWLGAMRGGPGRSDGVFGYETNSPGERLRAVAFQGGATWSLDTSRFLDLTSELHSAVA